MTAKKPITILILLVCQYILAQHDSIVPLREVTVSDALLRKFSQTQSVAVLNDSVIAKNAASLTALLNYNAPIYFKENGLGMVSSPSFRGTTAQQTAVIWNGININSQLNGLTDFNTITTGNFDAILVRAGGGSAIYGSSAIGGSVHLGNVLRFNDQFSNALRVNYGSFNTLGVDYNLRASNEKVSAQLGLSRNSSENDYEYLDTNGKHNENGQFYNTSVNADFGVKLNNSNYIKFYTQLFEGERHFSGTIASKSKSKYQDLNTRNLLEWNSFLGKFTSKVKVAFLSERYKYFENAKTELFERSTAETVIGKYDLSYAIDTKITANLIVDYTQTKGFGQQIGENVRSIGAASFLWRHDALRWFGYEISLRKETTSNYESPFLFAVGARFNVLKSYSVLVNASRNFRIPTFNDLYWQGLGNAHLKPESSYQLEIGQRYQRKNTWASATLYYIDISDMIQWAPDENSGNWTPSNVAEVQSYGAEFSVGWTKKIGQHTIDWKTNYGYTISEDKALKQQLIYVPVNKSTTNVAYAYRKFTASYQYLFVGQVYTPSQKFHTVKSYQVSNLGIDYDFGKVNTYRIGLLASNFLNENYQSVLQRPMPGRNYTIRLTLKF